MPHTTAVFYSRFGHTAETEGSKIIDLLLTRLMAMSEEQRRAKYSRQFCGVNRDEHFRPTALIYSPKHF